MTGAPTGLVDENRLTHIRARGSGAAVALCGIGVITQPLPGRFQPGDPLNCPACEELQAKAALDTAE